MTIQEMVDTTNRLIGQGQYAVHSLLPYFDEAVEEINLNLAMNLPLVSSVYENKIQYTEDEEPEDFLDNDLRNPYTRVPKEYLRNYVCYEASWRILRDEDEDSEVYAARVNHAERWMKKMVGKFSDVTTEHSHAILVNADVDYGNGDPKDDTALGYYNPYSINNPDED